MTQQKDPSRLDSEQETLLGQSPPSPAAHTASGDPSFSESGSLSGGRFAPGSVLGARFRIVDLLGRGGMGEVYRAEDLKLGETVALKFLPERLTSDGAALARLHRELRLARRITHRNVVRMHDASEADGIPFLVMEYVDGENLASLLKRIGRLPETKALELARQLCAGLAAAHQEGMIHRDLKPANIMVDGEGRAKISDFGLSGLATELEQPELAGTIAYMAPEQLAEGKASYASDLYSLGLVLYEMFSGERPFRGTTREQLVAEQREKEASSLSSAIDDTDPLVERAIAQCLERDPKRRPDSPLAVAAALPGGDPLAAALAAGETPSPEMVARASGQAALSTPLAATLLALTVVATLFVAWSHGQRSVITLDRPLEPEVLGHRAREILNGVGWQGDFSRSWFEFDDYRWLISRVDTTRQASQETSLQDELKRRPNLLELVYRSSAQQIAPIERWNYRVTADDPPLATSGIATIRLDSQGRLRTLLVPPVTKTFATVAWSALVGRETGAEDGVSPDTTLSVTSPDGTPSAADTSSPDQAARRAIDWRPLFEAAGLDYGAFSPTTPRRAPPFWAERLESWEGDYPGQTSPRVLVDAASVDGSIVWWQRVEEELVAETPPRENPTILLGLLVFALILSLGGWLAYRHLRSGRGDRRSATRLALVVAAAQLATWPLFGNHVTGLAELSLANSAVAFATLLALAFWVLYMALEPYARRLMPRRLTSWTRLLDGGFNDPLVGRDLLVGLAASSGVLMVTAMLGGLDARPIWNYPHGLAPLHGIPIVVANLLSRMTLMVPISLMALVVAGRSIVRSDRWAPGAIFVVFFGFSVLTDGGGPTVEAALKALMMTGLGYYVGLLGLIGFGIVTVNLQLVPVSLDTSLWWAPASWVGIGAVLLIAAWCCRCATKAEAIPRRLD